MRHLPSRLSGARSVLVGASVALGVLAALGPAGVVYAEDPTASPSAGTDGEEGPSNIGPATEGEAACTVNNTALTMISGMVATEDGIKVVESRDTSQLQIFTISDSCKVTTKGYNSSAGGPANPLEPHDIAVGSDGTLWVADTGSTEAPRDTVAVWELDGSTATIYRMNYPSSGKLKSIEAMLMGPDDVPILIANEGGKANLYQPGKDLVPDSRTNLPTLKKVGTFTPEKTGTDNPSAIIGNATVTGAAKHPTENKVVIRTASDAYEFTVAEDGDIVTAITEGTPLITPLPNEPNGKAITYSADGSKFLTLSAASKPKLLSYTPFVPQAPDTGGNPDDKLPDAPAEQGWLAKLSFSELTRIVAAVGVVGLVLAIAGIVGIRRARKRRREEEDDYDDYDYDEPRRGRRGRDDDYGFDGRDSGYGGRYEDQYGYADAGYGANGANGYGGGGYADPAYGGAPAAPGYGQEAYGQEAYGGQQYGAQPEYDPYAGQQYGGDYGGQQYGGQQYGGDYGGQQQYGAADYGGQQYGGADYGAQSYGVPQQYGNEYGDQQQYGAPQQYGGYNYEDDFDPTNDPRRR